MSPARPPHHVRRTRLGAERVDEDTPATPGSPFAQVYIDTENLLDGERDPLQLPEQLGVELVGQPAGPPERAPWRPGCRPSRRTG